ncbi:conserved Plasmodium protein, unknown function [Plasmodium vinckei vinckei]|uniref:Calpain catalytic domain-containing protein n=1 Tax=Plasmodium vinckei vinckei TaxID=54757 RepID=A0A449BYP8_PLAVN|nr:conserved Plasmodium protein, unknown function [Plasmodium vinckei vinckei]KEG04786.1 hypothetical protein YYE_00361 [Plasmodium vinckei vinckei]VEV58439.1 conserved Plasmodium protein, unknown function [Plasmodium vinckei vinckei]
MEYIFNKKNKIQIYENNEKVFDLWKKYVIGEVVNLCNEDNKTQKINNNQDVKVKYKRKKKFDKYIYNWKEINYFSKENEKGNNSQKTSDWEKEGEKNGCSKNNQNINYSDIKKKREILIKEENYLNSYEKQLDNMNKKSLEQFYSSHKNDEQKKTPVVVVSYENFVNRNVNIEYNEGTDFLKYIYSSISLINENKVIIPKGNYLYELIYPQTIHGFPLINKLNYYLVKLYINNNWVLVFVDLELPYDKNNNILSCQSKNDQKEIWIYILTKALYKIFRLFDFYEYHLYIFEMLTGYKWTCNIPITLNSNDNMIYNYNKNRIQIVLLNRDREKESIKNTYHFSSMNSSSSFKGAENRKLDEKDRKLIEKNINSITTKEDTCIIDKEEKSKDTDQGLKKIKKQKNLHFFQIFPFENNLYFIITYENVKPNKYIKYSDYIIKKKQQEDKILKGYKYINKQGDIIISNIKLIPVNKFQHNCSSKSLENCTDKSHQQKFIINDGQNVIKNNDINEKTDFINNIKNNIILNKQKYNIIINQNIEDVLQLFKEILLDFDQPCPKIDKNIHSKKHKKTQKDVSKWISEIDIEKILKFINVSYSSYYLIKLDNKFLRTNKIYNYIYYNHFSFSSTNVYMKSMPQLNGSSKIKNIDKYKDEEKGKDNKKKKLKYNENETQINNNLFLLLICSISICCEKNDKIQTTTNNTNCDNEKKTEEIALDHNCTLNNKHKFFNLSFFTHKEKDEYKLLERDIKKGGNSMLLNDFMNSINSFNKCEQNIKICKKNLISQEDVLSSECFIKQIGECIYKENCNDNNVLFSSYINNYICNIFNSNLYDSIFFQSKIEKKSISLKENKEHFFFIYIKDPIKSNLTIEWVNEKINKVIKNEKENKDEEIMCESKSINCSFFLLEEFLEKQMKMKINSFIKNINLKKENSNKILLKFIVTISREKEKENIPFYYLIQKINNIKMLSYLDIYVCKISKNHSEKRKKSSVAINEQDSYNPIIIGKFSKMSLKNIIFKFAMFHDMPYDEEKLNEKSEEYNYLFLIALKNVEKIIDQNMVLQIIAALPNKENSEKSEHTEILTINEVPSFCNRYAFSYYNDPINNNFHELKEVKGNKKKEKESKHNNYEKKNDKTYKNEHNISDNTFEQKEHTNLKPSKNKVGTYSEKKRSSLVDCNSNTAKTFTVIKKIKINDKSSFSYGSIFVELKNVNMFKYFIVKIYKYKKNELPINTVPKENETENAHKNNNDKKVLDIQNQNLPNSNYTSLDSLINSYKRVKIFSSGKRGKKKCVFIKHLEIDSKEPYYLYIKIRKNDQIYEKKKQSEMPNILTTKINEIKKNSLEKPYNNDLSEIILSVHLNFSSDVILKNDTPNDEFETEIKKYLKYNKIHFEDLKKNVTLDIKKEIISQNIFGLKNELQLYFRTNYEGIFNNFLRKRKINLTKGDDNKLSISKSFNISTQHENGPLTSENIPLENTEDMYLYKDELFDILSSTFSQKQLYDMEKLFNYISFKYFEGGKNKVYLKTFIEIFESIQKKKNYLVFDEIEKYEKNISNECNEEMESNKNSQNENCEDTHSEEFSHLFTYPNEIRKIIDNIKSFYNLKNKMDVLKLKMDAELQLSENIFPYFNKFYGSIHNIDHIIKYNYSHLEELEHAKTESEKNNILSYLLDDGILFTLLKDVENENKHETLKIIPPTIRTHDIINLVKQIDSFTELSHIKDMKLNVSKIIKERKSFIENIKSLLKHKKLKNLTSEELINLYKKGVKINLDNYNSNVLQMLKNRYTILNILISIKELIKKNNLKKYKTKDNDQNIAENVVNCQMQFLELFQTCSDLIKNNQNIQLNDFYNNIFKDSQKIYDELTSPNLTA